MADPFSSRTYLGDGTNAVFSVPFPYLEKAHVHVFVDGVETTAIQWLSSNSIRLTSTPAAGAKVKIMRQTTKDARVVDFQNGTNFVEADLDKSADQTFYIVQEAYDSLTTLIQQDNTGKWDALGKPISNLGEAVADTDAVTNRYYQTVMLPALQAIQATVEGLKDDSIDIHDATEALRVATSLLRDQAQASATAAANSAAAAKLSYQNAVAVAATVPANAESRLAGLEAAVPGKLDKSLFASAWDFIVGSGAAQAVKKTINEVVAAVQPKLLALVGAYTKQQYNKPVVRTATAVNTVDCDTDQLLSTSCPGGAFSFAAPTNATIGKTVTIMLYSTSVQPITWDAAYVASTSCDLPATTTAGKWMVCSFFCHQDGKLLLTGVTEEA